MAALLGHPELEQLLNIPHIPPSSGCGAGTAPPGAAFVCVTLPGFFKESREPILVFELGAHTGFQITSAPAVSLMDAKQGR